MQCYQEAHKLYRQLHEIIFRTLCTKINDCWRVLEKLGLPWNKALFLPPKNGVEKVHFYVCKKNIVCGKLPLLGNGVREGKKGSAHAVGELVKQDPEIIRLQAMTGVIQFWRRGLFVCTDGDLHVRIMT